MGVPAFFRWISSKYPSIVSYVTEDCSGKNLLDIDLSAPNLNRVEFDNLYLDMNGIIHPCTHPENKPAPKTEAEMMVAIFEYIDRLMVICRPRRLLYLAVDGVAPRAKMNQQRSRRFRAAKDTENRLVALDNARQELINKGIRFSKPEDDVHFDHNCITPGTEFMWRLAENLRYYVQDRMTNHSGWRHLKVILSDASVPGEGEHKIMDYIRRQRADPSHDPNTHHLLCGADADLIMLGLATHEPHFTIIREEFKPNTTIVKCDLCGRRGHTFSDCTGADVEEKEESDYSHFDDTSFIFIHLSVLREYLKKEIDLFPKHDLERFIDDWIFLCFFVGNDFVPHLPSLETREDAVGRLMKIYMADVQATGGGHYLTDNGYPDLRKTEDILNKIGVVEDEIFRMRRCRQLRNRERERRRHSDATTNTRRWSDGRKRTASDAQLSNSLDDFDRREEELDDIDNVKLHVSGFKERYYKSKFNLDPVDSVNYSKFRREMCRQYAKGLSWVLQYYFQGVPAWNWFYPYHYAPFASDFRGALTELTNEFPLDTKPFTPFEQLMAVFPAASGQFLPSSWRQLMSTAQSPIIDFYPTEFGLDLNGKRFDWQAVVLLPFVDEKRLFAALEPVRASLTPEEKLRNSLGEELIFVSSLVSNDVTTSFILALDGQSLKDFERLPTDLGAEKGFVIAGTVRVDNSASQLGMTVTSPYPGILPELIKVTGCCVQYRNPSYPPGFRFKTNLLPGVRLPEVMLKPKDYDDNEPYRPVTAFNYRAQIGRQLAQPLNRAINASLSLNYQPQYAPRAASQWAPAPFTAQYPEFAQQAHHHQHQSFPPMGHQPRQGYSHNRYPTDSQPYIDQYGPRWPSHQSRHNYRPY